MSNITHLKAKIIDSLTFFPGFAKHIGKKWFLRWEKSYTLAEKELSSLEKILKTDSVVFDIGANRGELSFFFASTCKVEKVYAFEPQKRMFNVLCGVAQEQKNIIPFNIAFSDSVGEKTIHIPVKTTGRYTQAASFETNTETSSVNEKVTVTTVDNFVKENKISKIDFIKCDTEGHELSVFMGAQETLKSLRPLLYIEIKKTNEAKLLEVLKNLNYVVYRTQTVGSENFYFYPSEIKTPTAFVI